MEYSKKPKKRSKKPKHEDLSTVRSTVSSTSTRRPLSNSRLDKDSRKFSKSVHRAVYSPIMEEEGSYKSSNTISYSRILRHTEEAIAAISPKSSARTGKHREESKRKLSERTEIYTEKEITYKSPNRVPSVQRRTEKQLTPKSSERIISARNARERNIRNMKTTSLKTLPSEEPPDNVKTFLKDDWREMFLSGKSKKFLEKHESRYLVPKRDSVRNPEVIVSCPIPSSHTSSVIIPPNKHQPVEVKPVHRSVSFAKSTSVNEQNPKFSFSMNRLVYPTAPKDLPKRLKPNETKVSKVKILKKSKKHQDKDESRSSSESEIASKVNVASIVKKQRKSRWNRGMLKNTTIDAKALRQDCHLIETVFENRKKKDRASRMGNLNILGKLYLLISFGGVEEARPQDSVIHYVTTYLCNNSYLLSQLLYIMVDAEDLKTCLFTIKVLYQIVIKTWVEDSEKLNVRNALSTPSMFGLFIESMHTIHLRFLSNIEYKDEMQKIHSHILQMIVYVCKNPNRKQLKSISEGTVKLIGKLVCSCQKSKDLARALLEIIKTVSVKKSNCIILANKKFFDGICLCYELTHKMCTVPIIFKHMARVKQSLTFLSASARALNLMLEMVCYNGKKSFNKQSLLFTLFKMSTDSNGLKLLAKNEMFYKLFYYFRKDEEGKVYTQRLIKIKAYSILNRAVKQVVLPNLQLERDLGLPEIVKKCLEEESVSDESEPENDESDEDSEESEESEEADPSCIDINNLNKSTTEELLSDMSPFYVEFLLSSDDMNYHSIFKFDVYEGIVRLTNQQVIEDRVHRDKFNTHHAYPDSLMLDPEFDDHVMTASINHYSKESLCHKIKCLKGVSYRAYIPRILYDLDNLQDYNKNPPQVPHPSTFVPSKAFDRTQITPTRSLKFESRFECGNLRKVIQIETFEYELLLTSDTSTDKGLQWFYFQVSNMVAHTTYTFNISNFVKFGSQHNYGMQPIMFSIIDYTLHKKGWQRVGEEIVYYGNHYTNERCDKQYRTLSFSLEFPYPNDFVYFAYHYPYTYTRLMVKLFPFVNFKSSDIYARIDKLCNTVKGRNELALLTITGAWNSPHSFGIPLRRRPIIFITARVHPGETNASWIMEGIMNFLLKQMDVNAVAAREHFIFKIIPMLNPEGVIYGNSRNGLTGSDLNRCWANPNKITCPEIYYAKRLIACAKKQLKLPVAAYIDIHGHSRKKYFFFYGCNPKTSWCKKDKSKGDALETLKILPDMVREMNPNIRLSQCKYKITKNRESTGRVVMWREFDIKHSYTLECSYSFASDKQSVNTKVLSEVGSSVIASLGKLADKAYLCKKVIPSLGLDFSCATPRLTSEVDKDEPLYVKSRAFGDETIP